VGWRRIEVRIDHTKDMFESIQATIGGNGTRVERIGGDPAVRAGVATLVLASMLLVACSCSGSSPQVVRHTNNVLFGVACASISHCIAVGHSGNPSGSDGSRTLILESIGDGWSIVPSPHPDVAESSLLRDVACASTTRCVAVGNYKVGYVSKTLIEENTGSGWTIVSSPNPTNDDNSSLSGVTCPTALHCIAVGGYRAGDGAERTLVEEDTGTGWIIVPTPNSNHYLDQIACSSAGRCIAIGSDTNPVVAETTGKGWNLVHVDSSAVLTDVSCRSATVCVIVGFSGSAFDNTEKPVILESAGSGWPVTPGARPDGALIGVTCATATRCIAVGSVGGGQSVIEERTGSGWILRPRLTLDTDEPSYLATVDLESVACAGDHHCVLVGAQYIGAYANGASNGKTLIAEDTGSGWAVVTTPNVGPL